MRRLAVMLWSLAAVSCAVDLPAEVGLACDETHPCLSPHVCVDAVCVIATESGGGAGGGGASTGGGQGSTGGGSATGGGAPGGGSGTGGGAQGGGAGGSAGGAPGGAGGGATSVPGWSQHVHGFTGQSVFTGCALEVDALRGNKVVSTIRSALDSSDRATANQSDAGALPKTGNGHLRGRFQLPSTLKLSANSTWLVLQAAGTTQLSLAFNSSGQLVCRTEAGMVGPTPITQTVTWPGGFLPNQDYLVDFTWKQGQFRRLTINGGNLTESLIGMDAGPGPKLDQLRLGIYRYDGTSDAGWTLTLSDWQLADDPNANLTD